MVLQGPAGQSPAFGRGMAGADRRVRAGEFPAWSCSMRPIRAHSGTLQPAKVPTDITSPGTLCNAARADGGKGHQHLHAQRNAARARLSGTENIRTLLYGMAEPADREHSRAGAVLDAAAPKLFPLQFRFAGLRHIEADASISPIIEQALAPAGNESGINGGYMTGFAHPGSGNCSSDCVSFLVGA